MKQRFLSLILTAAMAASMFNTVVFAGGAVPLEEESGAETVCEICGHTHDNTCGYRAAVEEQPCTHAHDENCGYDAAVGEQSCAHVHDADCGFVAADAGAPCIHQCVTMADVPPSNNSALNAPDPNEEPTLYIEGPNSYTVSSEQEFADAVDAIKADDSGAKDFTIVLTKDITNANGQFTRRATTPEEKNLVDGASPENETIMGIVGKHLTVKSQGEAAYRLGIRGQYLVGDLTLDNVNLSVQILYANGFTLELTENFKGSITSGLYGGSNRRAVDNTHLILNGGTAEGGGSGFPKWVYGGGNGGGAQRDQYIEPFKRTKGLGKPMGDTQPDTPGYQPPEFIEDIGDVRNNVVIDIGKNANLKRNVQGGGLNANVGGDVTINIASDRTDQFLAEHIKGAGIATNTGSPSKTGLGNVYGNVTINAISGKIRSIMGTGHWEKSSFQNRNAGDTCSVGGNISIIIGDDTPNAAPMIIALNGGMMAVMGCGFEMDYSYEDFSSIKGPIAGGDVSICIEPSVKFQVSSGWENPVIYGVGINSIVYGAVNITNNGAESPWGLVGCLQSGAIKNLDLKSRALSIIQNNGTLSEDGSAPDGFIIPAENIDRNFNSPAYSPAQIDGDVYFEVNGGSFYCVDCDYPSCILQVDGDIDVKITGGTMDYILGGKVKDGVLKSGHVSNLLFDSYGCLTENSNKSLSYAGYFDQMSLENASTVALRGSASKKPFYDDESVKNLSVDAGSTLALLKDGKIYGDLSMAGTLVLGRTNNKSDATLPGTTITLTAAGTAAGTGTLLPVDASQLSLGTVSPSLPVVNEEYVYAAKSGSNMTLDLANAENGLYVHRKEKDPNIQQDVWYIALDPNPKYTVTYSPNGGKGVMTDPNSPYKKDDPVTVLENTFTYQDMVFTGWNTMADGAGTGYQKGDTFLMPEKRVTLYAQWQKASVSAITLTPLDIASYTGGVSIHNKPFPAVRYAIEAPDGVDVSDLKLFINGVECQGHLLEKGENKASCVIPALENEFFPESDMRRARAAAAEHDAKAGVYNVTVKNADQLTASDGQKTYGIQVGNTPGKLTVRHLSDPEGVLNSAVDIAKPIVHGEADADTSNGAAAAVIPADAKFYTNGAQKAYLGVLGSDPQDPVQDPQIALLFDDIVSLGSSAEERTQLLIDHAKTKGFNLTDGQYQFKYLDLINENDGNAWVSADRDVTVFWPYPDEVKKNYRDYDFSLLHFAGLHREYSADIETDVANSQIGPITAVEKTEKGVKFTLKADAENGCFSPFALQWIKTSTSGGGGSGSGGGSSAHYTLSYESNGGTAYKDERYSAGTTVKLDKVPGRTGYAFTGWYADKALADKITEIKMTSDKKVYAGWRISTAPELLNGDDHFAYAVGYTDGRVRPLSDITRGEVTTIFFHLLKEDVRDEQLSKTNHFADVKAGMWHNIPISTMAKMGVVKGRSSQVFDPDAPITRAEFATVCAQFDNSSIDGSSNFTDISGHWAQSYIERAATLGWVQGYTDGTFRPENYITRAEAMTMINRVLCRIPENEKALLEDMIVWPDNQPGEWYYLAVQEATNSHEFKRSDEVYERWTKLIAPPDWSKYEN